MHELDLAAGDVVEEPEAAEAEPPLAVAWFAGSAARISSA